MRFVFEMFLEESEGSFCVIIHQDAHQLDDLFILQDNAEILLQSAQFLAMKQLQWG